MLSITPTLSHNVPSPAPDPPPRQPSPLPRRTDSLSTTIVKPKPTNPLVHAREDLKLAKAVLSGPIVHEDDALADEEARDRRRDDRERELTDMLGRMAVWVDELATLLQQAYKNQTDLETALTLTRSNLQLALANNEMLEEALKRSDGGNKDVGWRRWSEREGVRRSASVRDFTPHDHPNSVTDGVPAQPLSESSPVSSITSASRFFKSTLQRVSSPSLISPISLYSTAQSPTTSPGDADPPTSLPTVPTSRSSTPTLPHSSATPERAPSPPSPHAREHDLAAQLAKERAALQALSKEKAQLESELESLSQALFEEANKMVAKANRKLAETEEELRIATEQKEALRSALLIVEGENGQLRDRGHLTPSNSDSIHIPITNATPPAPPAQESCFNQRITVSVTAPSPVTNSFWSPETPSTASPFPTFTSETLSPSSVEPLFSPVLPPSTRKPPHPPPQPVEPPVSPTPSTAELSPAPSSADSAQKTNTHRWSIMPKTPRSRSSARSQFEQAMQRMRVLVGDEAEVDGDGEDRDVPKGRKPSTEGERAEPLLKSPVLDAGNQKGRVEALRAGFEAPPTSASALRLDSAARRSGKS